MTPLLLSKRQAAKLLGVGRNTLAALVRAGHVRVVEVFDAQPKISREECERFAREGTGVAPEQSSVPLPKRRVADEVGKMLEAFKLESEPSRARRGSRRNAA